MESKLFIGCDIGQDSFTFCLRSDTQIIYQGEVSNSSKSIKKWLSDLKKDQQLELDQITFCMEHTGIYGLILMRVLHERSFTICVESAANIKLSLGIQRGKNDKVDARRIAEYAMRYTDRLKLWKPKRAILQKLQLLNSMRARLIKTRNILSRNIKEVKRFMGNEEHSILKKGTQTALAGIKKDIKHADKQIIDLIKSDENLTRLTKLVTSVHGVGIVTCSALLVKTNEFQDFTEAKKFACTAGLAPFEHSSGTSIRGKTRISHRAHKDLKTLLHLCALGCISRKGEYKDYFDRKVATGKNKMLVINAIRNKIVHRVFAVVRTQVMYQENYRYNLAVS